MRPFEPADSAPDRSPYSDDGRDRLRLHLNKLIEMADASPTSQKFAEITALTQISAELRLIGTLILRRGCTTNPHNAPAGKKPV